MRKVKDGLRLRPTAGLSYRQIAASLQIASGAGVRYLQRAEASGLTWPLPEGRSEETREHRLFGARAPGDRATRRPPDFVTIPQEWQRKGGTGQLLGEEYRPSSAGPSYSSPQFWVRSRTWRQTRNRSLRQVHHAGETLFLAYWGPTVPSSDGLTGGVRPAQIFVAVLGASKYTYAAAPWTQSLPDGIAAPVRAVTFFGGVPPLVVPDTLQAGVAKAWRYAPDLNPPYADRARPYNPLQ
jgi:transposase